LRCKKFVEAGRRRVNKPQKGEINRKDAIAAASFLQRFYATARISFFNLTARFLTCRPTGGASFHRREPFHEEHDYLRCGTDHGVTRDRQRTRVGAGDAQPLNSPFYNPTTAIAMCLGRVMVCRR